METMEQSGKKETHQRHLTTTYYVFHEEEAIGENTKHGEEIARTFLKS